MAKESIQTEFQWKNVGHQYYAALSANLIMLSQGFIAGWFSPAVPLLMSENTPLASGPLTLEQLSWLGSINFVGSLFGTFTFGYITSFMGCKRAMTYLAIPATGFWLFIIFGNSFYHILIARFIGGWTGGGIQSTVILYVAEIANDNIRGTLGSVGHLIRNFACLVAFISGAVMSYQYIPYVFISVPLIFMISFILLPNTPQYLLQNDKLQEAENSLKYYKRFSGKSEQEEQALKNEFERLKSIAKKREGNENIQLNDIFERKALKGLSIGILLAILAQVSGYLTFLTYAVMIFEQSNNNMSPYLSLIILAMAQLFGTLCSTQLTDILGRKILLITSLFGCFCGLTSLAIYLYLVEQGFDSTLCSWIPVTSLSFVIFIASVGIVPLGGVCTVESLPTKIRTFGILVFSISLSVSAFLSAKFFPILLEIIQMHGCMMIYGIGCFLGILFVYFVMDETNGKSLETIDSKQSIRRVESYVSMP